MKASLSICLLISAVSWSRVAASSTVGLFLTPRGGLQWGHEPGGGGPGFWNPGGGAPRGPRDAPGGPGDALGGPGICPPAGLMQNRHLVVIIGTCL